MSYKTTTEFVRNSDGSITVPAGVLEVAAVFFGSDPGSNIQHLIELVGEANALALGNYAASLSGRAQPELLGMICEGWLSATLPLSPVLKVLGQIDGKFTLRVLIAQRVCRGTPGLADHLIPFYKTASGLGNVGK